MVQINEPTSTDFPLTSKVKVNTNFDQDTSLIINSPRTSSTPPSTPGLDTQEEEEEDDEDMNDYDDYEYDEYLNYSSEPEEDYFFKDFSTDKDDKENHSQKRKSKRYSRRQRQQKAMSKFDLQSFARQLHENRLSVLQTRQSRMILTEDDEKELEMLLNRKFSNASNTTLPPLPPLPTSFSSSSINIQLQQHTLNNNDEKEKEKKDVIIEQQNDYDENMNDENMNDENDNDESGSNKIMIEDDDMNLSITKATICEPSFTTTTTSIMAGPSAPTSPKPSFLLEKLNAQSSFSSTNDNVNQVLTPLPLSPSVSSPKTSPSHSTSMSNETSSTPSLSFTPILKKKSSWLQNFKNNKQTTSTSPLKNSNVIINESSSPRRQFRKSMSVDTLQDLMANDKNQLLKKPLERKSDSNDDKNIDTSLLTIKKNEEEEEKEKEKVVIPVTTKEKEKKSPNTPRLRLFGSLRRSASTSNRPNNNNGSGIRGLMRNLSTVGYSRNSHPLQKETTTDSTSISPAGLAVLEHDSNTKKQKKKKSLQESNQSKETSLSSSNRIIIPSDQQDDDNNNDSDVDETTEQITHTATSTKGGIKLLSSLLAKAKRKNTNTTKTINIQQKNSNDKKMNQHQERNKVVRRTIIYVQPDSLDFLKEGHLPPIPLPSSQLLKNKKEEKNDDDDENETKRDSTETNIEEFSKATKLTRQTSKRKRLVENLNHQNTNNDNDHQLNDSMDNKNKTWRLESVSEFDVSSTTTSKEENKNDEQDEMYDFYRGYDAYLEGLELREMSDGSVVWGIVKKQGNRKSFFASNALESMIEELSSTSTSTLTPTHSSLPSLSLSSKQQHKKGNYQDVNDDNDDEKDHDQIEKSVLALMGLDPNSLDHFSPPTSTTNSIMMSSPTSPTSSLHPSSSVLSIPPPIPKRSPRRLRDENPSSSSSTTTTTLNPHHHRLQRGLSIEEQLDEMMHSIKQL